MDKLEVCSGSGHLGVDYTWAENYQIKDGLLMRRTVFKTGVEEKVVLRVFVPKELRARVMRDAHDTVWGSHRNEKTTHL